MRQAVLDARVAEVGEDRRAVVVVAHRPPRVDRALSLGLRPARRPVVAPRGEPACAPIAYLTTVPQIPSPKTPGARLSVRAATSPAEGRPRRAERGRRSAQA